MGRTSRPLGVALLATSVVLGACRDTESLPPGSRPPVLRPATTEVDYGTGRIGAYGWQPNFLGPGYTGSGSLMSAGLPVRSRASMAGARGGGPASVVSDERVVPRGLAPGEHIGTPHTDGVVRVVVDPATGGTEIYSLPAR